MKSIFLLVGLAAFAEGMLVAAATAGKDAKGYSFNGVVVNTNVWRHS